MRKPPWVLPATRDPAGGDALYRLLRGLGLATVCEAARRPNQGECLGGGKAAFLALGDACTRRCGFCAVAKGAPASPDPGEPAAVAAAAAAARRLGLGHAAAGPLVRSSCRAQEMHAG